MTNTVLDSVLSVFESVGNWFAEFIPTLYALFWTPATGDTAGSLTFLGILAVAGLAFSVIFMVIGIISNYLHFRG